GYHITNILLHVISGYLLFRLIQTIIPDLVDHRPFGSGEKQEMVFLARWRVQIAFVVALIWIIYSIHNAAVAYVAGRADSLAWLADLPGPEALRVEGGAG